MENKYASLKHYVYSETLLEAIRDSLMATVSGNDTSLPVCEAVSDTLSCIKPTQCLSQSEADFLRVLIVTIYDLAMKMVAQIPEKFGSYVNAVEDIDQNLKTLMELRPFNEEQKQGFELLMQWLVRDYKVM